MLKHWGYEYKDMITWVKVDDPGQLSGRVGYHLDHASEFCLMGRKGNVSEMGKVQKLGLMQDVIVSKPLAPSSTEPKEIFEIIGKVIKEGHYDDIFGREHSIRGGWVTVGIQTPLRLCGSLKLNAEERKQKKKREDQEKVVTSAAF